MPVISLASIADETREIPEHLLWAGTAAVPCTCGHVTHRWRRHGPHLFGQDPRKCLERGCRCLGYFPEPLNPPRVGCE